ncbi:hypothetical protein CXG46_10715 [Nocardioides alpinus]|uniref:Integral membrane protein n=1 Tax=Nocardioides alpinus TaxID=748909 RepID=A0ABX4QXK8_9ACTN|nr:hypothetical protein CXG46_10715 [Nocardioides alpinus]
MLSTVLVLLAAVLAPVAVVASWADDQVGDTDRYVATVAPLAAEPAVQDAVIRRITDEVVGRLDIVGATEVAVDALADRNLPPRAQALLLSLSVPLATQVNDVVEEQVTRLVRSEQFEQAWTNANREAHTQVVALLTGEGNDVVATRGGTVSVNLATLIDTVKARLVDRGFALAGAIPEVDAEFTIVQSADLSRAQSAFRLLDAASTVLPWLAVALLLAGVAVSRSRRRTVVVGCLAVAVAIGLLGAGLNVARLFYLDAVPPEQLPPNAAAAIFDAVVVFIRVALRSVLVLFLALAVAAWVSGPGPLATSVRGAFSRGVDGARGGMARAGVDTGPVGTALHQHVVAIRWGVLGVALLVYVMAPHPTGTFSAVVVGVALLVLLVIEVLARPGTSTPADSPADSLADG